MHCLYVDALNLSYKRMHLCKIGAGTKEQTRTNTNNKPCFTKIYSSREPYFLHKLPNMTKLDKNLHTHVRMYLSGVFSI